MKDFYSLRNTLEFVEEAVVLAVEDRDVMVGLL